MRKQTVRDIDLNGGRALVRVDFNVPMDDGRILDELRLTAALPTIEYLREHGAKTILCSHLGRPKGQVVESLRLKPIANRLAELLGYQVTTTSDCVGPEAAAAVSGMASGDVLLLENVRFHAEEEANEPAFARQLAALADLYVNDAFGTAHRTHASTEGVAHHLPAVAGLLMERITSGRALSPEQTKTYYTTIDQELNRLERLVNRLLVSQQIQTGRKRYSFEPASIVEIVRAAIGLLRPQAETKAIRLELHAEDAMPDVPVDRTAIADVLENLLDNAIKYSPPDTCVTLTTRCADGQVHIDVCDQGIGIEPDERARIFDKFYRGRRGDQHDVRGTGLGLALVKAVVEAHNGTIEVTSTPGAGSCFSLRFPVANPDPDHGADSDR